MNDSSLVPPRVDEPLQSGLTPRGRFWGIATSDWDLLFDAAQDRLRAAALDAPASPLQAVVLDCVMALGYLHAALKEERGQCEQPTPLPGQARDAVDAC